MTTKVLKFVSLNANGPQTIHADDDLTAEFPINAGNEVTQEPTLYKTSLLSWRQTYNFGSIGGGSWNKQTFAAHQTKPG